MINHGAILIAKIFGNKFVLDHERLIPLSDKMISILIDEMVEEFFVDIKNYYTERGWYCVPEYQHLPNTNVTKQGILFFGDLLTRYRKKYSLDIHTDGGVYGLREAWKKYISTNRQPLSLKNTKQHEQPTQTHNFRVDMNISNTPFFERAKAIYYYNPYLVDGLLQTTEFTDSGPRVWNSATGLIDTGTLRDSHISDLVELWNDFVCEPHYNTHINKFIDFLLYFENLEPGVLLDCFAVFDNEENTYILKPAYYFENISHIGDGYLSAAKISTVMLSPIDDRSYEGRYEAKGSYKSYRILYFELLKIIKKEMIRKGSLFESISLHIGYF